VFLPIFWLGGWDNSARDSVSALASPAEHIWVSVEVGLQNRSTETFLHPRLA
jgi:hypothetical protein